MKQWKWDSNLGGSSGNPTPDALRRHSFICRIITYIKIHNSGEINTKYPSNSEWIKKSIYPHDEWLWPQQR